MKQRVSTEKCIKRFLIYKLKVGGYVRFLVFFLKYVVVLVRCFDLAICETIARRSTEIGSRAVVCMHPAVDNFPDCAQIQTRSKSRLPEPLTEYAIYP